MMSRRRVFNFFLVVGIASLLAGCLTEEQKRKRQYSNLRVHVESGAAGSGRTVSVHRASPIEVTIDPEPVLDEHNLVAAALVEDVGGTFAIEVRFDRQGSWILERTTVTHRGRRLVLFSYFDDSRWLAAQVIKNKNSSGVLRFTPDATREEAERIVRGLNNVARKLDRKENWPFGGGSL